jgi:lincosamide nucleotidyltransferase A/C/D/E
MSAGELVRVVDALEAAGCRGWLEGGWGVDALVGRQTRPHRDLDLDVDAAEADEALEVLAGLGYRVLADHRPHRVELVHPERGLVDLHLLTFDATGDAVQQGEHGERWPCPAAAFTTGQVHGRAVGTLTAAQQIAWHEGYELRDVDRADLVHLRRLQSRDGTGS